MVVAPVVVVSDVVAPVVVVADVVASVVVVGLEVGEAAVVPLASVVDPSLPLPVPPVLPVSAPPLVEVVGVALVGALLPVEKPEAEAVSAGPPLHAVKSARLRSANVWRAVAVEGLCVWLLGHVFMVMMFLESKRRRGVHGPRRRWSRRRGGEATIPLASWISPQRWLST